ncbi:MAG TPA: DUF4388 domain-containing protein [Roseiflexaceae bacterium]|nr:DUF4388 domain-containing protein [Roseiflexaceae bacterium]HMP41391.1 DUF4388 domain-containing protein [Roseiflexaceae bacterium]
MELDGDLDAFNLRELIEMVVYSSVTGLLEVRPNAIVAQLYFRDGLPYDAHYGDIDGIDALAAMFEQRSGLFSFRAGPTSSGQSLWGDPWELIETAEQRAASWQRIRPLIPALDLVPVFTTIDTHSISLNTHSWSLLSAIDGRRDIPAIAAASGYSLLDVCEGLVPLVAQRLIILVPCDEMPPEPAADTEQPAPGGFFERLIARALEEEAEQRRQSDPRHETRTRTSSDLRRLRDPRPSDPRHSSAPRIISDPKLTRDRQK